MNSHHLAVGTGTGTDSSRIDKEYSFIEALSLGPRESLSLVSKEALGLSSPSTPTFPPATTLTTQNLDQNLSALSHSNVHNNNS
ncbi:hypothetical protein QQX98_009364, partial [Neonectria punicea]